MDDFLANVAGLLVDKCLQYPVTCSLVFSVGLYNFAPLFWDSDVTKGWKWMLKCVAGFVLFTVVLVSLIPALHMTAPRIIFRPTPSCSTFDNPARYICFLLDDNHQQVFYITTQRHCNQENNNATNFFIISSWIPSFNHFTTTKAIKFQPASVPGEDKPSYTLPENYCVRAAGTISEDQLKVAFYSLNGSHRNLLDTGYINMTDLTEFHFGWYLVSSCRTDLERWWFVCESGYMSSHYVSLPEYSRILLLEQREKK